MLDISHLQRARRAALKAEEELGIFANVLVALGDAESKMNPFAVGTSGELGIWQLTPGYTASAIP